MMGVSLFHLFTFSPLPALANESVDLGTLYQQIDEAISNSSLYVADRERQINTCRKSFLREKNVEKSIQLAENLFLLYQPYRNDSALHYAEVCISLADSLHRPDLTGRFRSMLANQCSHTNMHTESLEQLRLVDKAALDSTGLLMYYKAWMHVCGELGSYTQRNDVRQKYYDLQNHYRDSVLMVTKEGSDEWFHLKMDILSARRLYQDALELSDQWIKDVTDDTHESAYAAFYRSMVYDKLNNQEMTCYWLGKSALDDIRSAVMDQASLLFLAEHLANDGDDIEHALRYVEFAKACNLNFCPFMRTYQVNSVINVIEKSRETAQDRTRQVLMIAVGVIVLLLVLLTALIIRKNKK